MLGKNHLTLLEVHKNFKIPTNHLINNNEKTIVLKRRINNKVKFIKALKNHKAVNLLRISSNNARRSSNNVRSVNNNVRSVNNNVRSVNNKNLVKILKNTFITRKRRKHKGYKLVKKKTCGCNKKK
jgi:hypothetical protein